MKILLLISLILIGCGKQEEWVPIPAAREIITCYEGWTMEKTETSCTCRSPIPSHYPAACISKPEPR